MGGNPGCRGNSPNAGLESPGFRNYADHMMTDEFHAAVDRLVSLGRKTPTAVMCSEKLYWRCHRRLLSDFLAAQGAEVAHIIERSILQPHKLTQGAAVTGEGQVIYPKPVTDS